MFAMFWLMAFSQARCPAIRAAPPVLDLVTVDASIRLLEEIDQTLDEPSDAVRALREFLAADGARPSYSSSLARS
jgi:hypothetical protein